MYKPLPEEVYLKDSVIHGLGLFAKHILDSGINLGMTHVYDSEQEDGRIRTPLGGFINHSEEPNCELIKIGKYYYLITVKDIMPDEEITLKYTLYEVSSL
jgi:SET domain-containing protein